MSTDWEVTVIEKPAMAQVADPERAVSDALAAPVAAGRLAAAAGGCRTACILICDITRPVPNGCVLPPIVRELIGAGMAPANITVLVATGLHRPNQGDELRELVGNDWVLATATVVNHFAGNDADHVLVGTTRGGTRVRLDRRFVDADLKIVTGLVEPHFMAGYSGGRKVIAPGIAHRDTITTFHNARFLEHPRSANCVLDGNPLHEELSEIAGMLGTVLAVNTVIDDRRRLSFVNYGDLSASHAAAIDYMRGYAEIDVDRRSRTVVTSGGGYPLDQTYYQTVKGMVGAMELVEPGGDIVILSRCSEGMGSAAYVAAQRRLVALGTEGFRQSILDKPHAAIDEWQTEMQLKPMGVARIHLFSEGLSEDDKTLTGVLCQEPGQDAAGFIRSVVDANGDGCVAVIPEGPYVIPRYRPAPEAA